MKTLLKELFNDLTGAFNPGEWRKLKQNLQSQDKKSFKKTFKLLIPQFAIYYILLSPLVASPLYNLILFHPTMTGPYDAHNIVGHKIQNIYLPSKNQKQIHGWFVQSPDATRVVLINHGNGGNITHRIPMVAMLLQDKVSVFVYDYQGYGKSAGSATVDNIVDDGEAAYQWLKTDKHYKDKDIIVMGESLGTGVAGQLAANHPVGAIILQSGFTSLYKLAQQKMDLIKLYPPFLFLPQKLDTQAVLNRPHAPLLIIHGMRDRIIPFTQSEELYRTAVEPKQFAKLPDAGHNDIFDVDTDQYKKAISDFLTALPTASQPSSPSAALSTAQTQAPDGQP